MIPIAGVSRSGQMLLFRKFEKAMKERPSCPLNIGVVHEKHRSQQGERGGRGKGMRIQNGLPCTG